LKLIIKAILLLIFIALSNFCNSTPLINSLQGKFIPLSHSFHPGRINAICEDSCKFLWVAGEEAIYRIALNVTEEYSENNDKLMGSGPFHNIICDSSGNIYSVGKNGMYLLDKSINKFVKISSPYYSWYSGTRQILYHRAEHSIYLSDEKVFAKYIIDKKEWKIISTEMGIGGQSMLHHSNNLVIVSDARINLTSTTFYNCNNNEILKTNFVCGISMIDFGDEELLFGSWRDGINIYNFKNNSIKRYTTNNKYKEEIFIAVSTCPQMTGDSIVWCFSEENGIYLFDKKKKEFVGHIDNEKGLADFKITAIYVGKKFLVLGQQGLSIIPLDNPQISYYTLKGISIPNTKLIIPTQIFPNPKKKNEILLSAQYFGAISYDLKSQKPIQFFNYPDQNNVYKVEFNYFTQLKKAYDESYWLNTQNGFTIIQDEKQREILFRDPNLPDFPEVTHFDLGNYPNIWSCSNNLLFLTTKNGSGIKRIYNCTSGSSSDLNRDILYFRDTIYVATELGIERYFQGSYLEPILSNNLKGIFELCLTHYGKIYALADDGIYILYNNSLKKLYHKNMNLSRYNYNMIKSDLKHNLWISLKSGLLQLNPENLRTVYYNIPVECLQTMEDGKILVTQNNGYLIIDPDKESSLASASQIIINNFKTPTTTIANNHLFDTISYKLKWSEKTYIFQFYSSQLYQDYNIEFETYLEGLDKTWQSQKLQNTIQYNNLNPGKYRFQVREKINNNPSKYITSLSFQILPPVWMTWWFQSIVAAGFFSALYYFILSRAKRNLAEKERQLEIQKIKVDSEIKVLRSQMNPHFIFNSLNTIEAYIVEKRDDEASAFLQKFSKLIRSVLENSQEEFISLAEELKVLTWYINLEQIRSNHKWDFSISVNENINSNLIKIPPLILQPFVENAIIHGLKNKLSGKGQIDISIHKNHENILEITIDDNGIGRNTNKPNQSKNPFKKKSLGMKFTIDRIINLNETDEKKYYAEIIDKVENGEPTGTSIKLFLPFKPYKNILS
jgi:ligand-binding sensor domain-containing protein